MQFTFTCLLLNVSYIYIYIYKLKTKLLGLSPRANYIDLATAACGRCWCTTFADRVFRVVSTTNPHGRILGFLDRTNMYMCACVYLCMRARAVVQPVKKGPAFHC
jgi:hypothetical protein